MTLELIVAGVIVEGYFLLQLCTWFQTRKVRAYMKFLEE